MRVGPARDVARGEDPGRAGFEKGVDDDAAVHLQAGRLGERERGRTPTPATIRSASRRRRRLSVTRLPSTPRAVSPRWKTTPCCSCSARMKSPEFRAQNSLHRLLFRRDDMDLDVARAQRGRDFEPDEARAQHDRAARRLRPLDDRPAVAERAKHKHVATAWRRGWTGARARRRSREAAGRREASRRRERDLARSHVDCRDRRIEPKVDRVVGIEARVAQRHPFLRRAAGEIVLGQVRPVDRRRVVAAQHDDAALVFPPPQHLGRGESRRAAADDHDPPRLIRRRARPCFRPGALLAHDDLSVALIHPPNINRT